MSWPCRSALALLVAPLLLVPSAARAQASFGSGPAEVVSELRAQDRGDASGTYELTTRVTDGGTAIEHGLKIERDVYGETTDTETLRVLEGDAVRATAASDPTALGGWSDAAVTWVLPFAVDFAAEARKNYRPRDKKVREIVQRVAPDAKVNVRAGTDGRTVADVEIPGERPVDELAEIFVGIRAALGDEDLGLARLRIRGTASALGARASVQ